MAIAVVSIEPQPHHRTTIIQAGNRMYVRFHQGAWSFPLSSSSTFSICAMFGHQRDPRGFQGPRDPQKKNMEPAQMACLFVLTYKHICGFQTLSCSVLGKCGIILSYILAGESIKNMSDTTIQSCPIYIDSTYHQICTKRPAKIGSVSCQYFGLCNAT